MQLGKLAPQRLACCQHRQAVAAHVAQAGGEVVAEFREVETTDDERRLIKSAETASWQHIDQR